MKGVGIIPTWVVVEIQLKTSFFSLILGPGIHKNVFFCSTRAQQHVNLIPGGGVGGQRAPDENVRVLP